MAFRAPDGANKISQKLQRKIFSSFLQSGLLLLDRSDSWDPEYHVRCPWVVFICKHSTSSREEENQLRSFCVQDVCTHISLRLGKQSQNLPTFLLLFLSLVFELWSQLFQARCHRILIWWPKCNFFLFPQSQKDGWTLIFSPFNLNFKVKSKADYILNEIYLWSKQRRAYSVFNSKRVWIRFHFCGILWTFQSSALLHLVILLIGFWDWSSQRPRDNTHRH